MTGPGSISSRNETRCARPGCANQVQRNHRGRPRLYCTPACRAATHRHQHPDSHEPLHVEIDHGSTSSRGRPTGHVWLVRLRRGNQQAIIACGLGRPSAEHLAHQIRDVINPPALATPPQIR